MRKHIALLVLSVLVLFFDAKAAASGEVFLTFPHSVVGISSHGNCLVVVHYQADDRNRKLRLEWDSPDGDSGSSETDINPENDGVPVAKDLDLSAGEYTFTATLSQSDGTKAVAIETRFITR